MTPLRVLLAIALGAILFAVGVAVGEALHDNPKPNFTITHQKTLVP